MALVLGIAIIMGVMAGTGNLKTGADKEAEKQKIIQEYEASKK